MISQVSLRIDRYNNPGFSPRTVMLSFAHVCLAQAPFSSLWVEARHGQARCSSAFVQTVLLRASYMQPPNWD